MSLHRLSDDIEMQDVEGITKQKRSIDTEEISSAVPSEKIIEMNENPGEFDNNAAWMSNFFKTKAIQPQNNETEANSGVIYSYTNKRTFQHSKKFLARQALKLKMMEEQTRKQMMEKEKKEREVQLKLLEIVKRNPVPIPKTKEDRKKAREIAKLERTKEKEKLLMERKAIREQERQKLKKMREERDRIKKKFQHQRQMRRKRYLRLKRERRYKQNAKLRKKVPPINTLCYEYYAKNKTDTPKDYAVPEFVWNAALKTFQRNKIHGMTEKRAFATNCVGSKINVSMLLTPTNLVKSMLLSYERRDWKTLYSIMLYALDEKMLYLEQQVMCYFFSAIQQDPVALQNKSLDFFLTNVKKFKTTLEKEEFMMKVYHEADEEKEPLVTVDDAEENDSCESDVESVMYFSDSYDSALDEVPLTHRLRLQQKKFRDNLVL